MVVGVEPLGHLHGGGAGAPPGHGEVGVQVDVAATAVALGHGTHQDAGVEHLVVQGEVVGGDLPDPGVAQERPGLAAQLPGGRLQLLGRHPAGPVALGGGLQLPAVTDPREPVHGRTTCHEPSLEAWTGRAPARALAGLRARGRAARSMPRRVPTGRRFPRLSGSVLDRGACGTSVTAVVPTYRCGAAPDSHRIPSLQDQRPARIVSPAPAVNHPARTGSGWSGSRPCGPGSFMAAEPRNRRPPPARDESSIRTRLGMSPGGWRWRVAPLDRGGR